MRTLLTIFLAFVSLVCGANDDLLEPEKAFQVAATLNGQQVEVRFEIAKGYYLYRHKIHFTAEGGTLGVADLPHGKVKQDEYFGKIEMLTGTIKAHVPLKSPLNGPLTLKIGYQGCAEIGVCFPPIETVVTLKPADKPAAKSASKASEGDLLARLKALAGGPIPGQAAEADILPPEKAFPLEWVRDHNHLTARFQVVKGYYLYRDKIKLSVRQPAGAKLGKPDFPHAEIKNDPNFGKMAIYHEPFEVGIDLTGAKPDEPVVIDASWQGCSEVGICYPPIEQTFTVPAGSAETSATPPAPAPILPPATAQSTSETDKIAGLLKGGNFWLIVATFFGFGLLLALTPCVFPMIPILSGIIVGQKGELTKVRGFLLSLAYVLGMALTYAAAGVAAGLSGTLISNALQTPWALGTGAVVFVLLSLSMFGFYELQLPGVLQSRMTETSNKLKGGEFTGVFAMGALSALIIGPCVAAPLAGALIYIGQSGDVVLGGVSLFAMAMGMGVPLLLVGLSAGALLPRAGGWMDAVKRFFGVLLLAVAVWLIQPLLAAWLAMLLWAALMITSAVYLGALDAAGMGWSRLWKAFGVLLLSTGLALIAGVLGGSRDLLQPLAIFAGSGSPKAEAAHVKFERIKSMAELDAAIARNASKTVLLDFYADWCVSCKEMEKLTFADPRVQSRLKDTLLLQADVTANTADDKALLKRFGLFGPPGILFFDKSGQQRSFKVVGYENPETFLNSLNQGLAQ